MTPRNINLENSDLADWFSQHLLSQVTTKQLQFNVSGEGVACTLVHPALLKAEKQFSMKPEDVLPKLNWQDWHLECFPLRSPKLEKMANVNQYQGWPKDIFHFLKDRPQEAIIHFEDLGSIYLTQIVSHHVKKSTFELLDILLPLWLDYALSPELWGQTGKWTRFHEQFHTLFEKFGLLIGQDSPGFYPLVAQASFLEEGGFIGKRTDHSFLFIPGWDFPLSGLKKLEEFMSRRQSCSY